MAARTGPRRAALGRIPLVVTSAACPRRESKRWLLDGTRSHAYNRPLHARRMNRDARHASTTQRALQWRLAAWPTSFHRATDRGSQSNESKTWTCGGPGGGGGMGCERAAGRVSAMRGQGRIHLLPSVGLHPPSYVPTVPTVPTVPNVPNVPNVPTVPTVPTIPLHRPSFLPYRCAHPGIIGRHGDAAEHPGLHGGLRRVVLWACAELGGWREAPISDGAG